MSDTQRRHKPVGFRDTILNILRFLDIGKIF